MVISQKPEFSVPKKGGEKTLSPDSSPFLY